MSELADRVKNALAEKLLAMGDDELILGHRDSEWCGHAPILEEDIAFANIALDEQGHAAIWYGLHAEVIGQDKDTYPDKLAFLRPPEAFLNAPVMELPRGDWAFSMLRQYLFDIAEHTLLESLVKSAYKPLADAAAKVQREEFYHLRHTQAWVRRLGLGTDESNLRMNGAFRVLWSHFILYFEPLANDNYLTDAGIIPNARDWRRAWEDEIMPFFKDINLGGAPLRNLRLSRTRHTDHLITLITEMQSVARLQPDARW